MAKRKSSVITEKQQEVVDLIMTGSSEAQAVKQVYNSNNVGKARTEQIQTALKSSRSQIEDQTTVSRLDVLNMYLEAAEMSRKMSEPATLVRAADSIAKMMGYNAPEVKRVELNVSQERMLDKMMTLPVEQLLAIADGSAVFDGEFVHVQ